MKQINLAYYHYYRKKYGYCGHLWQGRYKSVIIESDAQVLGCGKYIELNPVRAGIVVQPEQFEFSSYRYYALGQQDSLVTPSTAYKNFGSDILINRNIYANFVVSPAIYHLAKD
jgi:putative transposase